MGNIVRLHTPHALPSHTQTSYPLKSHTLTSNHAMHLHMP